MNDELNRRRQEYDTAQKLGERIERMCREDGWKKHFLPMIQKVRDEAQDIVNNYKSSERETQMNRGILMICDVVLKYEEEKKAQALKIMKDNATAKVSDD